MARQKKNKSVPKRKANRYRIAPEVKRERRKRFLAISGAVCGFFLSVFLISLVFVLGYKYLITTPILRIDSIEVQGCRWLAPEEIRELSGVHAGQNLVAVNLKKVRKRVEKNPWVESVIINRVIPDKLVIEIEEKEPVAVLRLKELYLVDQKGELIVPLKKAKSCNPRYYLVLSGLDEKEILKKRRVPLEVMAEFNQFLSIGEVNQSWFKLRDISEVMWSPTDGLALNLGRKQVVIRLGKGNFALKFSMLRKVLSEISRLNIEDRIKEIDLRCSRRVYISKRGNHHPISRIGIKGEKIWQGRKNS